MGTSWNIIYIIISKGINDIRTITRNAMLVIAVIVILEALASGFFYIAIQRVENPAIVAFIGSIGPVFVTILGIVFLKETYTRKELFGIVLVIGGVVSISYNGQTLQTILLPGAEFVLFASLLFAFATIIARKHHKKVNPPLIALLRAFLLFSTFLILIFFTGDSLRISMKHILYLSAGSLLEGLLTMVFAYFALKYIEAARTSLIISSKSIITLVIAWLVWQILPDSRQLFGGFLTIVGLYLISIQKRS